ncbi:AMP-binding protein [Nocardia sp. NPDC057668]|uniref:AMP-binding protein n=1 Tax=Nocardia sp. NPDC057668 TaxID=3346202 RepID=UPI0036732D55
MEQVVPAMSAVERHRLVDEWANGVELYDVPPVTKLIESGRRVPMVRTAVRYGGHILTYAELFGSLDGGAIGTAGPSLDGLARLFCDIAAAAAADSVLILGSSDIALTPDALAAAADDRRAVVADCRSGRVDPAYGSADVRLFATAWDCADAAVELLAALADGATLVLATTAQRNDPIALAELISTCAATHVVAEARTLAALADRPAPALPTVRRWDITGTGCPAILSSLLGAIAPGSVAGFAYTAPEYAGIAARGPLDGTGRLRPIPGARVLVLDDALGLCAPGVSGDVYLGGAALAAESGIAALADPFAPDGRIYPTGTRGRWNADGWLVFDVAESTNAAHVSDVDLGDPSDPVDYAA